MCVLKHFLLFCSDILSGGELFFMSSASDFIKCPQFPSINTWPVSVVAIMQARLVFGWGKYQSLKGVQRLWENCFLNPNSTRERAVKWTPVCCASGSQRTRQAGISHTGLPPSLIPSFLYVIFMRSVAALQLHFRTIPRKSSVVLALYASTLVKIRVQWARWQKPSGQTFDRIHFVVASLFLKKTLIKMTAWTSWHV